MKQVRPAYETDTNEKKHLNNSTAQLVILNLKII
jgi:hypothetical protein